MTASELATLFGGNAETVTVDVGEPNGWGWADAVLAAALPAQYSGDNPYEFVAYDVIADEWPDTCSRVERREPGADDDLRDLLDLFRQQLDAADADE